MMNSWTSAHTEPHYFTRSNWLRAGVLGANDGLISTASLLMGLAAADSSQSTLLLTGVAALVGGAVSMAAGEYVSVSSQADTERADLHKEQQELRNNPAGELAELIGIYRSRGLDADLAEKVAAALTAHNALQAHARDEIGIVEDVAANPLQAACASAAAFLCGCGFAIGNDFVGRTFGAICFVGNHVDWFGKFGGGICTIGRRADVASREPCGDLGGVGVGKYGVDWWVVWGAGGLMGGRLLYS